MYHVTFSCFKQDTTCCGYNFLCLQALQQEWMVTKGGVMPRPLAADVPRGAANVAAARRLRNMVHGTVAMDTGSQDGSQRGPQENMAEYRRRHTAEGVRGEQSRGYRSAFHFTCAAHATACAQCKCADTDAQDCVAGSRRHNSEHQYGEHVVQLAC